MTWATDLANEAVKRGAVQKHTELAWLLDKIQDLKFKSILEIGSKDGGTLWLWTQLAANVTSIDIANPKVMIPGVKHIHANSHETVLQERFDFIFIDGDHTYEGAKEDFLRFYGGLIALHDIVPFDGTEDRGVDQLWSEIKENFYTDEFIDPGDFKIRGETLTKRDGGIGLVYV